MLVKPILREACENLMPSNTHLGEDVTEPLIRSNGLVIILPPSLQNPYAMKFCVNVLAPSWCTGFFIIINSASRQKQAHRQKLPFHPGVCRRRANEIDAKFIGTTEQLIT